MSTFHSPDTTLKGRRVVELSYGDSMAAVCGRLLADLGAHVVVPSLSVHGRATDLQLGNDQSESYDGVRLGTGKHCDERLSPDDLSSLAAIASECDILIIDGWWRRKLEAREFDAATWRDRWPHLVVGYLTSFGLDGPLSSLPDNDLLVQAVGCLMSTNGREGDPPIPCGVPVSDMAGAMFAVTALLAALYDARLSGRGEVVDVAGLDAVVCLLGTLLPTYFLGGDSPPRVGNRHLMTAPWNSYRTSDGWVVLTTMGESLWQAVARALGESVLIDDSRFISSTERVRNVEELDVILTQWTSQCTTADVLQIMTEAGVPCTPINSLEEALGSPLAAERGLVRVRSEAEGPPIPGSPIPRITPDGDKASTPVAQASGAGGDKPLSGVRIVELGALTAGPLAGRLLALLGAEVLKLEPPKGENSRHLAGQVDDVGYLYYINNTDKRGATLDVRTPVGRETLRSLVDEADVLLTNLSGDFLRSAALEPADVLERHRGLIYCTISGYGLIGSRAGQKSFDTIVQAETGIMDLTGRGVGSPLKTAISFADLMAGAVAAAAIVAALHRAPGSDAVHLDTSLFDGALWSTQCRWGEVFNPARESQTGTALNAIRRCKDGYIAVGSAGYMRNDELFERSVDAALEQCVQQGVPATPVLNIAGLVDHPHVGARNLILEQRTPGGTPVRVLQAPWKFSRCNVSVNKRAPGLGEHPAEWKREDNGIR